MKTLHSFLLGIWEFRSSFTTNPGDDYMHAYDTGRDLAHRVTFRRFERG